MSGIIYLILLWYLWLFQTFVAAKNQFRFLTAFFILWLIIIYPVEWSVGSFVMKPSFLLICCCGFLLLAAGNGRKKWRSVILSGAFAFLFASLRMAEWYEPILFLFGHTLTYVCSFFFLIFLFSNKFTERLSIVIVSTCAGEILYQIQLYPLTSTLYLGQPFVLDYVVIMIALFYGWNIIKTFVEYMQRLTPSRNINLPQ
ncbi:hypothetical protein D7Z54_10975 [Salibacterium salarium]|uniref:Uncharacterized protein n=1 Tax=Salibacterium salarium TaxID=284579 RepID=A0A428N5C0_9BACI|nr:hypothetical protein [Salibacterium salarium]RSL33479.1 hypothetical protein D7Z54_10975 [Salibacterium salarium]